MNRIYADNAATTKMSDTAVRAMTEAIADTWGNPSSLHTTGQEAKRVPEAARETFAKYLRRAAANRTTRHCAQRSRTVGRRARTTW